MRGELAAFGLCAVCCDTPAHIAVTSQQGQLVSYNISQQGQLVSYNISQTARHCQPAGSSLTLEPMPMVAP
jgi:hypothetical protein